MTKPRPAYTHEVVNKKGEVVGRYTSLKTANRAVDRKDNEYGGYAHTARPITVSETWYPDVGDPVRPKPLKHVVSKNLHPNALHVKPVKVNGKTMYQVHAVGKNLAHGIKRGEKLDDTGLDDATEIGAKIKHIKESENGSWFGNAKKKTNSVSMTTSPGHEKLQTRGSRNKAEGTEESVDHVAMFAGLLSKHGYQQKLVEWRDSVVQEQEQGAAIKGIKKNIETRKVSTDKDTDVIRDFDADDPAVKQHMHHHKKVKHFRAYFEDVNEAISARQALSKAADFEFKAANTDSGDEEEKLKGKAKALRRAARLAQEVAGTVQVSTSKIGK